MHLLAWLFAWLGLCAAASPTFAAACSQDVSAQDVKAACITHLRSLARDLRALRALAASLEREQAFDQAQLVYRQALQWHATDRELQQGFIRVRSMIRARGLLAGLAPAPPPPPAPQTPPAAASPPRMSTPSTTGAKTSVPSTPSSATADRASQPAATFRPRGTYRAIVVGNQHYRHFQKLRSPVADVQALAALLRDDYGFAVETFIDITRHQLFAALAKLRAEAGDDDSVLIYFAGHGYVDQDTQRGYWLPIDAETGNEANWVSTSDITNLVAGLNSRHALVIADSCFSGALTRAATVPTAPRSRSLLQQLAGRRSRVVMTSGGMEPVLDRSMGPTQHSVFAAALIGALRDNRAEVEAGRLFVTVRDRVNWSSEQTPQYAPLRNAGHDGGDFVFVRRLAQ
jgi:hypothetical protein